VRPEYPVVIAVVEESKGVFQTSANVYHHFVFTLTQERRNIQFAGLPGDYSGKIPVDPYFRNGAFPVF